MSTITTIGPMSETTTAITLDIAEELVVILSRSAVGPMATLIVMRIRTANTIAAMIRIVVRRAVRVFERMENKTQRVPLFELVRMVFGSVFVGSVSFS